MLAIRLWKLWDQIWQNTPFSGAVDNVPLPCQFNTSSFTIAAFENFDNNDRNSLPGTKHAHNTAITIFQVKPQNPISKPKKCAVET